MNTITADKKIYKAIVAFQASKIQNANLIFKNLIKTHPKYAPVHYNAGVFYKNIGKFAKAISLFETTINLEKNYSNAYFELGSIHFKNNQLDKAKNIYLKILKLPNNNNKEVLFILGEIYQKKNNFNKAITYYRKCLSIDQNDTKTIINLGYCYQQTDKEKKAIAQYRMAYHANNNIFFHIMKMMVSGKKGFLFLKPIELKKFLS